MNCAFGYPHLISVPLRAIRALGRNKGSLKTPVGRFRVAEKDRGRHRSRLVTIEPSLTTTQHLCTYFVVDDGRAQAYANTRDRLQKIVPAGVSPPIFSAREKRTDGSLQLPCSSQRRIAKWTLDKCGSASHLPSR